MLSLLLYCKDWYAIRYSRNTTSSYFNILLKYQYKTWFYTLLKFHSEVIIQPWYAMSYVLLQWSNQPILPNVIVLEEHVLRALKYMTLKFATNLVLNLWQENLGSIYRHTWQLPFWQNHCYLQSKIKLCTESQVR